MWGLRLGETGAAARLWAPGADSVRLLIRGGEVRPMAAAGEGWWALDLASLPPGARYMFEVDGKAVPDPAALSQPDGPSGWSEAIRLDGYPWRCDWAGRPWHETVLYELHVGTFSPAGTFLGAIEHLDHLVRLGVTTIELMPVGTFPGARNWGYDGVLPFAPDRSYGTAAELQRLVDECHLRGLSITLDVVYNHFGPEATFLGDYAPAFFTDRHKTPWGPAVNFDGARSAAVRAFYVENALLWLGAYRFDGLRLDAVQAIVDESQTHILTEIADAARGACGGRPVHLMLENDLNQARWLEDGGGYDAQWNDDFHHVMRVLLAGQTDGYYQDYAADPIDHLGRALTGGFSYQGQESKHRPGMHRGTASGHLPPVRFVNFLQNHDQVGNAPYGQRLPALAPAEAVRLGAAVLLLAPGIPMLFMGEEWAAGTPFDFFCDYGAELADAVRNGRRDEFKRFDAFQSEAALDKLADPVDPATRTHSVLDWHETGRAPHAEMLALHAALLALRHKVIVPLLPAVTGGAFVPIGPRAMEARWQAGARTLVMAANFSHHAQPYSPPPGRTLFCFDAVTTDLPAWSIWVGLVG